MTSGCDAAGLGVGLGFLFGSLDFGCCVFD